MSDVAEVNQGEVLALAIQIGLKFLLYFVPPHVPEKDPQIGHRLHVFEDEYQIGRTYFIQVLVDVLRDVLGYFEVKDVFVF